MAYMIDVNNISKIYKNRDLFSREKRQFQALDGVSFTVNAGEIFSIVGLNGAGKTSVIKSILGLIKPTSGYTHVFGDKAVEKNDYYKIGYLPEISYYPKQVTLYALLIYYANLYGIKEGKKERVDHVIEKVGLGGKRDTKLEKFSKGMLQRVGIAQAILNKPTLLILDEPMSGLDPLGRKMMMDLLTYLNYEHKTTIILTTHILSDIEKLGGKIGILNEGKMVKIFDYKEEKYSHYDLFLNSHFHNSKLMGSRYKLEISECDLEKTLEQLLMKGIKILAIERRKRTLENIFFEEIS